MSDFYINAGVTLIILKLKYYLKHNSKGVIGKNEVVMFWLERLKLYDLWVHSSNFIGLRPTWMAWLLTFIFNLVPQNVR